MGKGASQSGEGGAEAVIWVPLHRSFSPAHLLEVVEVMKVRGAPELRATFAHGRYFAREGCHRLRAAVILGLRPVPILVPWPKSPAALEKAARRTYVVEFGP
jgi:hypothetical protein